MAYEQEIVLLGMVVGAAKGGWDYIQYKRNTDEKDQFMAWMFGSNPEIAQGINIVKWILIGLATGQTVNIINHIVEHS